MSGGGGRGRISLGRRRGLYPIAFKPDIPERTLHLARKNAAWIGGGRKKRHQKRKKKGRSTGEKRSRLGQGECKCLN